MARIQKIKIYTNRRGFVSAMFRNEGPKKTGKEFFTQAIFGIFYYTGLAIIKLFGFFKNVIVKTCFHTGNIIFLSVKNIFLAIKNDVVKTAHNIPKRFRLMFTRQFARSFLVFFIVLIIGISGLQSLSLVAKGLELKSRIMHTAFVGNFYLSQAKQSLLSQDSGSAENAFAKAYLTFSRGQQQLDEANQSFALLLNLLPQKKDADRLIKAAGLMSQAGTQFISLQKDLAQVSLGASGVNSGDRPTAELLNNINDNLRQILSKTSAAQKLVQDIDEKNVPNSNRENFEQLKSQLSVLTFALTNFNEVFELTKNLALGEKNVLVLFENNNELRAGGGFIGTYGNFKIKDGKIISTKVSSIYDLDGQLTESIKPPGPMLNVNQKWYMRDSNWFADFPQSAKIVSNFYEKEGGETPDLVIAMTPNLIIDLLKVTGPINLPNYNLTLTSDNFIEQTQVATTLTENSPINAPKQILADLVPILLQNLNAADKNAWPVIIQSLQNNLNQKQIAIYAKDPELTKELAAFNWNGAVMETQRDYLSVISSNLGGTKSDLYIESKNELKTTVDADGLITNELTISRTNKLPNLEGTENISYLRVLVPQGSKLVSVLGFDYKNLEFPESINYKIDSDVYQWEKNSVRDVLSGTTIGQESNKTFFGNWLTVKGGETRSVKIVYQLPFKLGDIDSYSLLVQKQIGQIPQTLNWNLDFDGRKISWKNFDPVSTEAERLASDIILDKDYFLGLVLTK